MVDKKIIGLTGTYCAGKNYIAHLLEKRGIPVLDIDKLGYKVIEAEKGQLMARFGRDILVRDGHNGDFNEGCIDRKRLGQKVFGKPAELAALEDIIHPAVNRETLAWIEACKEKACVINAALLHRSSAFELLDAVIIVKAPLLIRLLRAKKRDKLPWTVLLKRFYSQRKFASQYSSGKTDIYRVENSCFRLGRFSGIAESDKRLENRIGEILSLRGIT